ncbi:MAG: hypothetical protein HC916_00055 [Coleofasciculaceae cyanobacterium SM2_1_6]|nr:hypothetical protein [Coleofasciculaceae cyanobacterium SM2_1_6]
MAEIVSIEIQSLRIFQARAIVVAIKVIVIAIKVKTNSASTSLSQRIDPCAN